MPGSKFSAVFGKTIRLLKETKTPYLLIGGLAASLLGEARVTNDADFIIVINDEKLKTFLKKAKEKGFKFPEKKLWEVFSLRGLFRLFCEGLHVDFIRASTELEKEAFKRKKKTKLFRRIISIPSPEDMILFKTIPGREIDLIDIKRILTRHWKSIDRKYLEDWAMKISDEAEDARIYYRLKKIMKEVEKGEKE
jgi:hypothetical protein